MSDKSAKAISTGLCERVGTISPETILTITLNNLRGMGISEKKAEYIINLVYNINK